MGCQAREAPAPHIGDLIEKGEPAMARRHNGRRVKIHRTYTITEDAAVLGAHKQPMDRG